MRSKRKEEEIELPDYTSMFLGELQEMISDLEDNPPKDKRTKDYSIWKDKLNELFKIYNEKAGWQAYKTLR